MINSGDAMTITVIIIINAKRHQHTLKKCFLTPRGKVLLCKTKESIDGVGDLMQGQNRIIKIENIFLYNNKRFPKLHLFNNIFKFNMVYVGTTERETTNKISIIQYMANK